MIHEWVLWEFIKVTLIFFFNSLKTNTAATGRRQGSICSLQHWDKLSNSGKSKGARYIVLCDRLFQVQRGAAWTLGEKWPRLTVAMLPNRLRAGSTLQDTAPTI